MLLGDDRTRDEHGLDIENIRRYGFDGYRIRDERLANSRAWVEALGTYKIRKFEECPLIPYAQNGLKLQLRDKKLILTTATALIIRVCIVCSNGCFKMLGCN